MKGKWLRALPLLIAAAVCGAVFLGQRQPTVARLFENIEWDFYDWRVRLTEGRIPVASDRLATVEIDDASVREIALKTGWWWPIPRRHYAEVLDFLKAEGARVVGFDLEFVDAMPDQPGNVRGPRTSDEAFASSLRSAGNAVLAVWSDRGMVAAPIAGFLTNALAVGSDVKVAESDNVLRRMHGYQDDAGGRRVWNLGLVLAARALDFDLSDAEVLRDRIILRNERGMERVLPVDAAGRFLVPWAFRSTGTNFLRTSLGAVLAAARNRREGWGTRGEWRDRLVLVYSTGSGNNVRDLGPTPFSAYDHHGIALLNTANAVLTGAFIRRSSGWLDGLMVVVMAMAAAGLSWRLRAMWATAGVAGLAVLYLTWNVWAFGAWQLWVPCVWPLAGALLTTHVLMIAYRVIVEWTEAPVRLAFGGIVSSNVIDLLLREASRNFVGTRRSVTVLFADIRGFTGLAERAHQRALKRVAEQGLKDYEADAVIDSEARETLETVNCYLNTVADVLKAHAGTLDKYIGDCLTAFWGAPLPTRDHAARCVRAAVAARQGVQELNDTRRRENERRQRENTLRAADGRGAIGLLPILEVGIGIHTGPVLVGFMGAKRHIWNYSIFGREVIIASRLERLASHDQRASILLSESTEAELRLHDVRLAEACRAIGPTALRGFEKPMVLYELP